MADHHGQEQRIEGFMKRRQRRSPVITTSTWLCVVVLVVLALASVGSAENETKNRPGLFSHVNNWFSRLRGNRDQNNNNNDDKKTNNDDKKEETSTKQAVPMYAMPGMPPGFMASPYGAPMMAAAGPGGAPPMYGMALPTNQFVNHAVPGAAPGGPRPLPMAFSPMAMGPPMSANPFAFAGAHMMP